MPTRTRQVITNQSRGNWQAALAEAERQLRMQANMGRTQGQVSQQAIVNRARQIGGVPPRGTGPVAPTRVLASARGANSPAAQTAANDPLARLIEAFQSASDDANTANRERRDQITGGFGELIDSVLGRLTARENTFAQDVAGYGGAQADRINRDYNRLGARSQADLVSRGLTASTIMPSVLRGVEDDRQLALRDLGESVSRLRMGQAAQLSGDTANAAGSLGQNFLGFLERINETGPDFGQLAQLAQLFGQGNSGQGFNVNIPTGGTSGGTVGVRAPSFSPTGFQPSLTGGGFDLGQALVGAQPNMGAIMQMIQAIQRGAAGPQGGGQVNAPMVGNVQARPIQGPPAIDPHREIRINPTRMVGGRGRRLGPGTAVASNRYPASVYNPRH